MKPIIERSNITIVGRWNRHVFNPDWVSQNLFQSDKVQVEFSFDLLLPPRYSDESARINVFEDRLVITPLSSSISDLQRAEELAIHVLEMLPHTPLSGIGFNYGYECENTDFEDLVEYKDSLDSKLGLKPGFVNLNRSYVFDKYSLSVSHQRPDDIMVIDFNFHFDAKEFVNNSSLFAGKMLSFKSTAENILNDVYGERNDDSQ